MNATPDITLYSYSHHNTTVEQRDQLAFSAPEIVSTIPRMRDHLGGEVGILSTCNRTELYLFGDTATHEWGTIGPLLQSLRGLPKLPPPNHQESLGAARHLFRVASSLESMALGENQILAQVKDAHELLLRSESKSPVLDRLFQFAVRVGKRVRTDTGLCAGAVSISSASIDLARKVYGDLSGSRALLVGAGETNVNTGLHFQAAGVSDFTIVNRGQERGEKVAAQFHGSYRPMTELLEALEHVDIAVFATGSPTYLIEHRSFKKVMRKRRFRQLLLIDISNPRNVDPKIHNLNGAYLFNIDDLRSVVEANLRERVSEIPQAEDIIETTLSEWDTWVQSLRVRPTISSLAQYFHSVRKEQLERYAPKLSSEADQAVVDELTRQIVKKLLHHPIMHLRRNSDANSLRGEDIDLIHELFQLHQDRDD